VPPPGVVVLTSKLAFPALPAVVTTTPLQSMRIASAGAFDE
jgi:hypothetical protein